MEKTPHVILAGDGALQFALAEGFPKENLLTPKSEADWKAMKARAVSIIRDVLTPEYAKFNTFYLKEYKPN